MIRAGGGYYGNPYKDINYSAERIDLNGGLGFRFRHFFSDLGFVHSMYKTEEQPYTINPSGLIAGQSAAISTATINSSLNNLALTVGVKF